MSVCTINKYNVNHLPKVLITLEEVKAKLFYLNMISHEPTLSDVYQRNYNELMDKVDFCKGEVSAMLLSNY